MAIELASLLAVVRTMEQTIRRQGLVIGELTKENTRLRSELRWIRTGTAEIPARYGEDRDN